MTLKKKTLHMLLALVLTFFIISGSVIGTLAFRPLYYHDIGALDIERLSGMTEAEIRENYDALISYNMRWEKGMLEFPTLPQSREGQIHFAEVKDIFDLFKYLALGTFFPGAAGIFLLGRKREFCFLKYTSVLSVALPAVVGAFVAVNWDSAFVLFHRIAFDNDYWLFDPATDPVITMLPDAFFLHCALLILGGILLGSLVCAAAYKFYGQKEEILG